MDKQIGRNDSCSCGSGKKYKKCCGRTEAKLVQRRHEGLKSRQIVHTNATPLKAFASKVFQVLTDTAKVDASQASTCASLAEKVHKKGQQQEPPRSYNTLEELLEMENRTKNSTEGQ